MRTGKIEIGSDQRRAAQGGEDTDFAGRFTGDCLMEAYSNPRGFAHWFEMRARLAAMPRLRQLVERRLYASVEEVPPYEWRTPLQASIQILKRHRCVSLREKSLREIGCGTGGCKRELVA